MNIIKRAITIFAIITCLNINCIVLAEETAPTKYPDYSYEYVGNDKHETLNRKIFLFNTRFNKYALKPLHTVWASIMPKYMITRIQSVYINVQYPKRVISALMQKNFKSVKNETIRFLTNTTVGLGGLYDPAEKYLHINSNDSGIEEALANTKIKRGSYLVLPFISSTCPRDAVGQLFDFALNPTTYIATPVMALVKLGFTVNRTSYMQPICKMIESTFADPYDITKKLYGIESYIKNHHLDNKEYLDTQIKLAEEDTNLNPNNNSEEITKTKNNVININQNQTNNIIKPDIVLPSYNAQCPVTDSMRTALFELPDINNSIWNDLSVWNHCFSKKIKTSSINVDPQKVNYNYRYLMQHDKNSPVAIIYPSIGEGINAHHSVILAKLFYDKGYSVIIQGSNFQWEFVKSMPNGYYPGNISNDADYLKLVTSKIVNSLQTKYNCTFKQKVVIGTSYGALATLFLGDKEYKNNTLNINEFIAVNPPVDLLYAMKQMDKNTEEWKENPDNLKEKVALTAAKIIELAQMKDNNKNFKISTLPFNEDESKLITGFVMHQKLSDLMFTIENIPKNKTSDFYKEMDNMNYHDYAEKYLVKEPYKTLKDMDYITSLYSISDYLRNSNNYKIYHALDDYLVTHKQLCDLKNMSGNKLVLLNHGGHLGFLYRPEFIQSLTNDITGANTEVVLKDNDKNHQKNNAIANSNNNSNTSNDDSDKINKMKNNNQPNLKENNKLNNTVSINTEEEDYKTVANY